MLHLRSHRRCPGIANHSLLLRRRPSLDSTSAAVVADPIPSAVRHLVVVNMVNSGRIHIRYRTVIFHSAVVPISAVVAAARISITVIDAAIVSDVRTPIATVPMVGATIVTPPGRRPERAHIRGHDPSAGNPVITGACIAPVAGRPNVIVAGSGRLIVFRQRRRRLRRFDGLIVGGILCVLGGVLGCWRRRLRLRRDGLIGRGEVAVGGITTGIIYVRWLCGFGLGLSAAHQRYQQQYRNKRETAHGHLQLYG
jgi:hypothetical protein